jgi:calcineurin-like phosphoesterase family protein
MKNTRDIIENVLLAHFADYDLAEVSSVKNESKSREIVHLENGSNILVSENEHENENLDDMETYQPYQEIDIDVNEVKEGFEKKKKKRNYIEFRPDYLKIK